MAGAFQAAVKANDFATMGVKSPSLNRRFVIALHSPLGLVETGLRFFPSEKKAPKLRYYPWQAAFSGAVSGRESWISGHFLAIFRVID